MVSRGSHLRLVAAAMLLLATGAFLRARSQPEVVPARMLLLTFPRNIGSWTGEDSPIPPEILDILGPGEFLSRVYETKYQSYVDLFVAYFPSQRTGDTIHSPKNCLPGAGWVPVRSQRIRVRRGNGQFFLANQAIIAKGSDRALVLYWYQSHGRQVASEYSAKLYLVADSIRMNRSDGALVRITTPLELHENPAAAQERVIGFAEQILPLLGGYIPR
jgi:EpsI family protein